MRETIGELPIIRHSCRAHSARAGTHNPSGLLNGNTVKQVVPIWVVFFNQSNLPISAPFLDLFFPGNRGHRVVKDFKINEALDAIPSSKTVIGFHAMLMNAPDEVIRDTQIKCPMPPIGEEINAVTLRSKSRIVVMGSGSRGLQPLGRNDTKIYIYFPGVHAL